MARTRFGIPSLLVLAATAALGAACTAAQPAREAGPAAGEPGAPTQGGIFSLVIPEDPWEWDPSTLGKSGSWGGLGFATNSLTAYDSGPDIPFSATILKPAIAEQWEVSPDSKTFTFHIRHGVRFANLPPVNGRELTSADVKFSFEYYGRLGEFKGMKTKSQNSDQIEGLAAVDTPDPYTAVLHFDEPFIPFLNYSAAEWLPILPREIYDQDGSFKDRVIGTGPFQLDVSASQSGSRWVWKKNRDYWDPGKPHLDEVRWLVLKDRGAEQAAFQTRQVDYLGYQDKIGYTAAQEIAKANPAAGMGEYTPMHSFAVYVNTRVAPLDDQRVRRALQLSLDRDGFLQALQGGHGGWEYPGVFSGTFSQEETRRDIPYDPAEARRLVAEAGYPEGAQIEMTYDETQGTSFLSMLQLFQASAKQGNILITLKALDNASFSDNRKKGKYMLNINQGGSTGSSRYDPNTVIARFHPASPQNYWGTNDPALTSLIEAQQREPDPGKRRELIRSAARILVEKAYMPGMFTALEYSFWQPHVKNLWRNGNAPRLPIQDIWLDK